MLHFLAGHQDLPPGRRSRVAIVTLCVGDLYLRVWQRACREGWERYAMRHDYDVIVITEPLDGLPRSPSWQKLLILEERWARDYERIVWVDSDIMIAGHAPDIVAAVPDPAKVGAALSGSQMSPAEKHIYLERLYKISIAHDNAAAFWRYHETLGFREHHIPYGDDAMINGGLLVVSPAHHRELFAKIYAQDGPSRLYEQPHISRELALAGLLWPLSARFNWSVHEAMVLQYGGQAGTGPAEPPLVSFIRGELEKSYFLHFCGSMPVLTLLASIDPFPLERTFAAAA